VASPFSIRWLGGAVVLAFLLQPAKNGVGARHQATNSAATPIHLTAERITSESWICYTSLALRRGVDGDPRSANAANHDEEKSKPDPKLPDPLTLTDGS